MLENLLRGQRWRKSRRDEAIKVVEKCFVSSVLTAQGGIQMLGTAVFHPSMFPC